MNSVFLTRRAMLSGGTLLGLGALLAACKPPTRRQPPPPPHQANRLRRLRRFPMPLLHRLLRAQSLPAATLEARRRPTANTAKLMVTALRRMFLCRKPSRSSTPKPSLDSVR